MGGKTLSPVLHEKSLASTECSISSDAGDHMVENFNFVRCWLNLVTAASCLDRMSRDGFIRDGKKSIAFFVDFVSPIFSVRGGVHLYDQIRGRCVLLESFTER